MKTLDSLFARTQVSEPATTLRLLVAAPLAGLLLILTSCASSDSPSEPSHQRAAFAHRDVDMPAFRDHLMRHVGALEPIEGVWSVSAVKEGAGKRSDSPNFATVAIVEENDHAEADFVAVVVSSERNAFPKGSVVARFSRTASRNLYTGAVFGVDGSDTAFTFDASIPGLLQSSKRASPGAPSIESRVFFLRNLPSRPVVQTPTGDWFHPEIVAKNTGTGWMIGDGYLVTCLHVVEGMDVVTVAFTSGRESPAAVVATDNENDLAILEIADHSIMLPVRLPVARGIASRGTKVFTVGFPDPTRLGFSPKYSEGSISSTYGMGDNPFVYTISIPLVGGNSGGPLLNQRGQVVGVVSSSINKSLELVETGLPLPSMNYAIKGDAIIALSHKLPRHVNTDDRPFTAVSVQALVETVRDSVVLVHAEKLSNKHTRY